MAHLIDYAHWETHRGAHVQDAETGEPIKGVIEANAVEGWFTRHVRDAEGRIVSTEAGDEAAVERIEQAIRIWWSETWR